MSEYNPDDLIGRTFLLPKNEQGERLRATIKRKVIETSKLLDDQHDNAIDKINFHLVFGQGRAEAIMSYVQILDHLDQQEQQEDLYKFRHILVVYKALYGLKRSGLRWSQRIHDIMLDM